MSKYVEALKEQFEVLVNKEDAKAMAGYMKNVVDFIGIKTPVRRNQQRSFFKEHGYPEVEQIENIVKELWLLPYREYQYLAMELIERYTKNAPKERIDLYEWMILNKSWWDTIDFIAPKLVSQSFKNNPEQIKPYTDKWINSGNIWLQRSSILYQLKSKDETDLKMLYSIIERLNGTNEFFINKAIGWILREYSKTNPDEVQNYIENHDELSNLSKREGLKVIERAGK